MKECRFCDLDNTLIFSHRHEIGDRIVVEYLGDREQSYMQTQVYELFRNIGSAIIPLTSRTCAQYDRIVFPACPEYALLDNGGILLINDEIDKEWLAATHTIVSADLDNMRGLQQELANYGEVKWQDDLVIFLKLTNLGDSDEVKKLVEKYNLLFFEHGTKRYVCSQKMNKGMAIKRFKDRFAIEKAYMAGDSLADFDTAPFVDVLYLPHELMSEITDNVNITYVDKFELAERILRG